MQGRWRISRCQSSISKIELQLLKRRKLDSKGLPSGTKIKHHVCLNLLEKLHKHQEDMEYYKQCRDEFKEEASVTHCTNIGTMVMHAVAKKVDEIKEVLKPNKRRHSDSKGPLYGKQFTDSDNATWIIDETLLHFNTDDHSKHNVKTRFPCRRIMEAFFVVPN